MNQEEVVIRTVVGDFSTGDIVLNTFVGDKKSDKIPSKNDGYSISKVVCDNDVEATWNEEQWSLLVTKVTRRTKCSLYFTIIKEYDYSGKEDIFTVLESGTYKLETWGAQGGSYNSTYHGGYGSGISGTNGTGQNYNDSITGPGADQTHSEAGNLDSVAGTFWQGDQSSSYGNSSGGGGGFYGGASSLRGAGGGSGYIGNSLLTNKVMYCYNCAESSEEATKTIPTTCNQTNLTENCSKIGAGYAKITLVEKE